MISSKQLIEQSGISRATLNNYIQLGLLPKPEVRSVSQKTAGGPRLLGYFPQAALVRVDEIRQLKREGLSMDDIVQYLTGKALNELDETEFADMATSTDAMAQRQTTPPRRSMGSVPVQDASSPKASRSGAFSMPLTLDDMAQPAYMLNYNLEIVWYNESARTKLFGFGSLPDQSKDRSLFKLLSRPEAKLSLQDQRAIALMNLRFALVRVGRSALEQLLSQADPELLPVLESIESVSPNPQQAIAETVLQTSGDSASIQRAYAVYFREGILIALSPQTESQGELLDFLSRRDRVIEGLLRKRLPVLTPLAVLVADLQHSVRICSELPPDEYFELINQTWSTMAPILRKYCGTYGKHVGDGMVYYFFPQPESNYLFNALGCATEIREAMHKISAEWQLKKRWFTELQLNIGLHEGQEWLGTFQTVNRVEFVVLGDTINYAARLSDFARHGSIWATKNLVSKLTPDERSRVEFGVQRQSQEYGDRFIPSSYAQVDSLIAGEQSRNDKLHDIGHLAVTEIRRIGLARNY